MPVLSTSSVALAALLQVKATPGNLYQLIVHNDKGSAQYVQVHNSAATPTSQTPIICLKLAAAAYVVLDFQRLGLVLDKGIFVGNSSTAATYTAGSADCYFFAQYI